MALDTESIAVALTDRLRAHLSTADVPLVTRSITEWRNAPKSQRPSVLVLCGPEDASRALDAPPIWVLRPSLHVYFANAAGNVAPDTAINAVKLAIETAMERQTGENTPVRHFTTLGGEVQRCWVSGSERVQNESQQEAELRVDLEILKAAT